MKKGFIWTALGCLIVTSLILASCNNSSTTTTTTTTKTTSTVVPTSSTTTTSAVVTSKTTVTSAPTGHWWDSLGKPQYGGTITFRMNSNIANFDPFYGDTLIGVPNAWMENLVADDWTLDPAVFDYEIGYRPSDYNVGNLASSWEFTDPSTYVIHLRQGIRWQTLAPANGREFIADDVVFHYNRMLGRGSGYTKISPYYASVAIWANLTSITATDKYTVVFKWNITNPTLIVGGIQQPGISNAIECPDAVKQWGDVTDWHHAIGTGPFILQDFVSGGSATLVKNPFYFAHDERYPQNQLPYADKLSLLIIYDDATSIAGLRTGKIDAMESMTPTQAQTVAKTNPEILQKAIPLGTELSINPRNDVKPFSDIRVREALQMAIDIPTIAKTYYGGQASLVPATLTEASMTGWSYPYDHWPQTLKDTYTYNPAGAKKLLSDAGYPTGFNTDVIITNAGDLDLVQIVKSYFAAIGVNMTVQTMDNVSFNASVYAQHKFDAMAMRSQGEIGLNYDPFRQLLKYQSGYQSNLSIVADPVFDAFYNKAMAANSLDAVKQVVVDANKYVAQQHFVVSISQPSVYHLYQPWLKGWDKQSNAISNDTLMGFYAARFWVDQNLKKSSGH